MFLGVFGNEFVNLFGVRKIQKSNFKFHTKENIYKNH